jgi:hypothetical protein
MATIKKAQLGSLVKAAVKSGVKKAEKSAVKTVEQQQAKKALTKAIEKRTKPTSRPSFFDEFDMPESKSRGSVMAKKLEANNKVNKYKSGGSTPAWQRKEGKSEAGGLNAKGVASYRRANPGSKLKTAVTTKPSKLKAGSKAAGRRKSFCSRMSGMKKKLTSAKTANDPNSRINKSLRKWNC